MRGAPGPKLYHFITDLTERGGGKKGLSQKSPKKPKKAQNFWVRFWSPADLRTPTSEWWRVASSWRRALAQSVSVGSVRAWERRSVLRVRWVIGDGVDLGELRRFDGVCSVVDRHGFGAGGTDVQGE